MYRVRQYGMILIQILLFNNISFELVSAFTLKTNTRRNVAPNFQSGGKTARSPLKQFNHPVISDIIRTLQRDYNYAGRIYQSSDSVEIDDDDDDDDDEEIAPNKMRVSEIKAELDLREVLYNDCFDKESLVQRLEEARASGKSDPKIIDKFNKQRLEEVFNPDKKIELKDDDIARAVANDGKLPGGLLPDEFKKLSRNPEIMSFLQSTKVQDAMKLMMTGGREELESKLKDDPEMQETLAKLESIMKGTMS